MIEKEYLKDVIGIEPIRNQLIFYIKNFEATGIWKPLIITGSKSQGKTHISINVFKHIKDPTTGKIRKLININCSTLESLDDFFDIIKEHCLDTNCSLYFDESEALNKTNPVALALLTILAPNPENQNTFIYKGESYTFSFKKLAFIFSTNEIYKMNPALVERVNIVSIPNYKLSELAKIAEINLSKYKVNEKILENIASVSRSSPRSVVMLAQNIDGYLQRQNKRILSESDWENIRTELGILPRGLNHSELELVRLLSKHPGISLTKISCMFGASSQNVRLFQESFLLRNNFIQITQGRGRELTAFARKYLADLNEDKDKINHTL